MFKPLLHASLHSLMSPYVLILNFSHYIFTIFLLDIRHICHIMASSGKPSGPGHLANDPYLCDICGRGFPTKEEYETQSGRHWNPALALGIWGLSLLPWP